MHTSTLKNILKKICKFDDLHIRFYDHDKYSELVYISKSKYWITDNKLLIAESGIKSKNRRYKYIIDTLIKLKESDPEGTTFYGSLVKNIPSFSCIEELIILMTLNGID